MRVGGLCALFLCAGAVVSAQTLSERVLALNRELLQLTAEPGKAAPARASASLDGAISARAQALQALIETDPKRALELALPDSSLQALSAMVPGAADGLEQRGTWAGPSEVAVEDGAGFTSARVVVTLQADRPLAIYFADGQPPNLATGAYVSVEGVRLGSRVAASRAAVYASAAAALNCSPDGEQRVAVILVSFPGTPPPLVTNSQLHEYFFGASGASLDGFWRENSYGKTSASGGIFGPYELDRAYGCSPEDANLLRAAAISAADRDINFRDYNRIFIFFPEPPGGCSWSARGTLGCGTVSSGDGSFTASTAWIWAPSYMNRELAVFLAAHEGGHNLGLNHSRSRDFGEDAIGPPGHAGGTYEYGDWYDAMGNGLGHYNAQHKLRLGWLTESEIAVIDDIGSQRIMPVESQAPGIKALKVRRQPGANDWLWFEYHQPLSPYALTWPWSLAGFRYSAAVVHLEDSIMQPGGPQNGYTALVDFTPASVPLMDDFLDAPLRGNTIWVDRYTSRSIRVGAPGDDGITIEALYASVCVTLAASSRSHGAGRESGTVDFSAPAGCGWTVMASAGWITIDSATTGEGSGSVRYTLAENSTGRSRTGTIAVGAATFTITQAGSGWAPTAEVVTTSGSGPIADLQFRYSDRDGLDDLQKVALNLSAQNSLAGGCAVEYDSSTNAVRLADDAGNWSAPQPLDFANRLSNSQCALERVWSIKLAGDGVSSALYVTASARLLAAGPRELKIFALATDKAGLESGWVEGGTWRVEPNTAPSALSVSPVNGTGLQRVFTVTVTDVNGGADISSVRLEFTAANGAACIATAAPPHPYAYQAPGELLLSGGSGQVSSRFGSDSVMDTPNCRLDPVTVRAHYWQNTVSVRFPLTFKPSLSGQASVRVTAIDRSGGSLTTTAGEWNAAASNEPAPFIKVEGTVNAASFRGGPIAPGEIVTLFGTNLGPSVLQEGWYVGDWLPQSVSGTEVFFDNVRAPIIHTSSGQVSAVVPYSRVTATGLRLPLNNPTKIRLEYNGIPSNEIEVQVAASAPGVFTTNSSGFGQAVAVNGDDNSLNSTENPARRGSFMTIFITGEGQVATSWPDGRLPGTGEWPHPVTPPVVTFGGVPGKVDFAGLVWAGVTQINVIVPENAPAGVVPLTVSVAGRSSPDTVTVALR